jgi:hypothetical protein
MVAQVSRRSTSASGYITRQGSRSSARLEKCFKSKATRARGTSSSAKKSLLSVMPALLSESERRTNHLPRVNAKSSLTRVPSRAIAALHAGQTPEHLIFPRSFRKATQENAAIWDGRIAQLVEQLTLNQRVQGSSPCAPTNQFEVL